MIQKICKNCGKSFEVYPSEDYVQCCSKLCGYTLGKRPDITKEKLESVYIIQRKSVRQLSQLFSCNHRTILRKLKKYNIPIRHGSEAIRTQWENISEKRQNNLDNYKKRFNTQPTRNIGKRGYWLIYVPGRRWIKEHHYIWEKNHGPLPEGQVIHHINFDRLDNRIENMRLMTQSEHMKLHQAKRIIDKYGRFVPSQKP